MTRNKAPPEQSSMFDTFAQAETERATAHLPATMEEGILYFRQLLERHHAAVIAADIDACNTTHTEISQLAVKLNGGTSFGMCVEGGAAHPLELATDAPDGEVPLYGQRGSFVVVVEDMKVRVEMDGVFGIGASTTILPSFSANAVERDKPFLSETGYRSFLGYSVTFEPGTTPDQLVTQILRSYVERECRGTLLAITKDAALRRRVESDEDEPQP